MAHQPQGPLEPLELLEQPQGPLEPLEPLELAGANSINGINRYRTPGPNVGILKGQTTGRLR